MPRNARIRFNGPGRSCQQIKITRSSSGKAIMDGRTGPPGCRSPVPVSGTSPPRESRGGVIDNRLGRVQGRGAQQAPRLRRINAAAEPVAVGRILLHWLDLRPILGGIPPGQWQKHRNLLAIAPVLVAKLCDEVAFLEIDPDQDIARGANGE